MEIYTKDEEDWVPETYKEQERPVEELEKLSIGEENLRRRMKYYFKVLIILLFDDLEIQWNLKMEEIEVGLEEEEP